MNIGNILNTQGELMAGSSGNCYLCGTGLGKTAMKNHILKCHEGEGGQECLLLKIEGAFDKDYWLYVDVPLKKTLSAVDGFLRRIWLECCGHLSEFYVPGLSIGFGMGPYGSGRVPIGKICKMDSFAVGDKFFHVYDFGTTSETVITVMGKIRRKPQKSVVRLLARNAPPVFKCADCGKTADYICIEYDEPFENLFYCAECSEKNEDDEHMMLPVTNSPRMGMCGYEGELDDFEFRPCSVKDE
jgi:hypothetical protein